MIRNWKSRGLGREGSILFVRRVSGCVGEMLFCLWDKGRFFGRGGVGVGF